MRIALVAKKVVSNFGGAERHAESLARTLHREGHEVHLVSSNFSRDLPDGIVKHDVAPIPCESLLPEVFGYLLRCRDLVRRLNCDIVYALTFYYPTDLYRAGDGVFRHWLYLKHPGRLSRWGAEVLSKRRSFLAMERKIYEGDNCKRFIVNSQLVKRHIGQYYHIPSDRIHVVYNGVDHQAFYPGEPEEILRRRHQLGINEQELLILFVAHNWQRKGLETLLKGAARLIRNREARLFVVGRGKVGRWTRLIRDLGIAQGVSFIDATPNVADWYQIADCMVLPTQYDPFANVCLEAMACAVPVITTFENGVSELIEPSRNGFLLSSANACQELESQLAAFRDASLRDRLKKEALVTARYYTLEENARQTLKVFDLIAGRQLICNQV